MTDQPTIASSRSVLLQLAATENDGYHGLTVWQARITVRAFPQLADAQQPLVSQLQWNQMEQWLDTYLRDKDLSRALHFAPTVEQLASYLGTVMRSVGSPNVASVTVSFPTTGEAATYTWPQPGPQDN